MVCKNKLLLINPWQTYPKKLASEYQSYVPYGIACIASVGIMQGFDVKIIDCLVDDTETDLGEFVRYGKNENDLRNEIISFAPDIVGISCIFSMFEKDATDIASLVKSIDSRIIVILGGVTATLPEIYEPLLGRTDAYDLMVRGEGEEIFAEILKRYCKEQKTITDKSKIKGIAYKTTDGIVSTDSHPFIRSLDSLPFPALELLDIDKMLGNKYYSRWRNNPANKRSFPIFTSRGCPYNCCFCSVHSQVGYQHRMYSIDYVLELMKKCIVRLADTDFYDDYNIINSLGLEYELLFSTQKISTLSGGEKIKIQLLKLLSDKPDALLLDEPSNDLDIDTLIFLESFIRDSAIPIIFISHDEMLISSCANVIIHIEQLIRKTKCSITVSRLTYEDYLKFRNLQFDRQNQIAHKERSEYTRPDA